MGATYTFANATTNFASAASQSKYESITAIALRIRCKGDTFANLPAYANRTLFGMANRGGFKIGVGHDGNDGSFRFYMEDSFQGTYTLDTSTLISSLSSSSFYFLNLAYGTGGSGFSCALYDAAGTLIVSASGAGANMQNAGAGNGAVRIGNDGTTAHSWTLDGLAAYSATALVTPTPTTGDSGIIGGHLLDEGSGTSLSDLTGGTSLTISGSGTWNAGDGAWGAASRPLRPWFF